MCLFIYLCMDHGWNMGFSVSPRTYVYIYISRKDQQRPCKPHQGQPVFAYSVHSGPTGRFCYRNIDSMHV